ncbi:helix-turn-helix transcriptional regulator [Amycolatopsis rubida]|uniref:Helix-turn-helix transcriptional regulator n=1 Tax=Amycolatopsis rubida TaxID=112413 RepID=A0ABX0C3U5_9PSEU|nr:transcriptional regulator [Amycolatopsis rubida]MYW95120.1 transcriptional regulator [Amycolatopsis rubida]NEC55492.1 helix-turn-helix transcriptional regulator [Amycolatopsis rubida]NEC60107.1 helix-turn-helix transcriptional regulator [Amycolatopsis rubida]
MPERTVRSVKRCRPTAHGDVAAPARSRPDSAWRGGWDAEQLCKLSDVKRLFSGDWMHAVIVALADGPKHYKELLDTIRTLCEQDRGHRRTLHESVLARTLKTMTADGLIIRCQQSTAFPPSVQYSLSPATAEALDAMMPMVTWATKHAELIQRSRDRRCNAQAVGSE